MTWIPRSRILAPTVAFALSALAAASMVGCSSIPDEPVDTPVAVAPLPKPEPPPIDKPVLEHMVVKGDSLWKLARDYDTSVAEIKQANALESDLIKVGKSLKIPTLKAPPAIGATAAAVTGSVTPGQGTQPIEGAPISPSSVPSSSVTLEEPPPTLPEKTVIPSDVPFYRDALRTTSTAPEAPSREINVPSIVP